MRQNHFSCSSKYSSGLIAIVTSIILSFLIILVATVLGSSAFFSRSNDVDFLSKQASYFLARSCLDRALLELAGNSNYSGNETITIDSRQCTINPVETSGSNKIIKAAAQVNSAVTNLKLTVVSITFATVSLEEVSSF